MNRHHLTPTSTTRLALTLAAASALLIACGGDDAADTEAATTPAQTPTTAPAASDSADAPDPAEVELVAWCIANAPVSIEGPSEEVEREMAEEISRLGRGIDPPPEIAEAVEIFNKNAGAESTEWRLAVSQIERFWGSNCGDYVELGTRIGNP